MLPEKFKEKMKGLLDEAEYEEFIRAFDEDDKRVPALRINELKTGKAFKVSDIILKKSEKEKNFDEAAREDSSSSQDPEIHFGLSESRVPWEERGFYYDEKLSPGTHPYHEAGVYYIQEPSAMAPVSFLDPKPGERVLDLCASPGGKTTQIADRMKGKGILVTNEINRDRCRILSLNVERMGIRNALVLNEDSGHLSDVFEGYFDKILLDAPCSGEGMFRKNEQAFSEWSPGNVQMCAERQSEILDNAAGMLLPGGRLVYSTCTFSPEENEINILKFLKRHSDFHTEETRLVGGMEHGRRAFITGGTFAADGASDICEMKADDEEPADIKKDAAEGKELLSKICEVENSVRLWPHRVRGEGHFFCVLRRDGETDREGLKSYVPGGRFKRAPKDVVKLFREFAEKTFSERVLDDGDSGNSAAHEDQGNLNKLRGEFLTFGDQLYLAPSDMPNIQGLKVLRPGLHLGTVKKDRFEPGHALALTLSKDACRVAVDIESTSPYIRQYLNGQSIRLSGDMSDIALHVTGMQKGEPKGWCLVCVDGYSIGWGKLSSGMLKNHYPKGLRINY